MTVLILMFVLFLHFRFVLRDVNPFVNKKFWYYFAAIYVAICLISMAVLLMNRKP